MPRRIAGRGILLEQHKEPALSRPLRTLYKEMPRQRMDIHLSGNPSFLAPHEILAFARAGGIIDESDGRSLWRKIVAALRDGASEIVVDAIDDEPYISSQLGPALYLTDELAAGIELLRRAIGARKIRIEVYDNMVDTHKAVPRKIGGIPVTKVSGLYPAEYREGRRSRGRSVMVVGACAIIHLKRAIYEGCAQTTTFITLAGNCTLDPGNYEVPLGTTVAEVLGVVGLIDEPRRIVVGGSMTGFCITDPETAKVAVGTRGILTFSQNYRERPGVCIGCGRCIESCPQRLSPYHIYRMLISNSGEELKTYDIYRCIGCGTCSYVCPAKINLSHTITISKSRESFKER